MVTIGDAADGGSLIFVFEVIRLTKLSSGFRLAIKDPFL